LSRLAGLPSLENTQQGAVDSWRKPLFASLLRGIRFRSSVYWTGEFRAPWGVNIVDLGTVFHIVEHGGCWLQLGGEATFIQLSAGDLAVITRGKHTLRDAPATLAVDFADLVKRQANQRDRVIRTGGRGPITRFVCGGMQFENGTTNPLLAVLPPLLHVKTKEVGGHSSIRLIVEHILSELDSGEGGAAEIVTRLAEILFIQAVCWHFEKNADTAEFGWLAAVRDRQIGRALALLHSHPAEPWTIASLARRVALSRSAFASKFTELMGEPPLHYLTRLRIDAAARRLHSSDDKLSAIAAAVGYESVTAFTRTFRREMGMTPGNYRESRWGKRSE
jgi:AraC-like DNA-binding protein